MSDDQHERVVQLKTKLLEACYGQDMSDILTSLANVVGDILAHTVDSDKVAEQCEDFRKLVYVIATMLQAQGCACGLKMVEPTKPADAGTVRIRDIELVLPADAKPD